MRSLILILSFLLICGPALAAKRDRPLLLETEAPGPSSVEDKDRNWQEGTTNLPPWPNGGDLVEFSVDDPTSRFRYYIDGRHLLVGADGAVRYTLVVESPSGVRNLSVEGLRCTPNGAFKIYAYGNNGRFEKTASDWTRIQGRRHDKLHHDLHQRILCILRGFEPRPKQDMIRVMRAGTPDTTGTGFLSD